MHSMSKGVGRFRGRHLVMVLLVLGVARLVELLPVVSWLVDWGTAGICCEGGSRRKQLMMTNKIAVALCCRFWEFGWA